jgi:hypothetical protein
MTVQNLSSIIVAMKKQGSLGTPASGAGAYGLELLPSQGMALNMATIESQMIQRSRMRKRPRHGSKSVTASYETELMVGAIDPQLEAVLGNTWEASQTLTQAELTDVTITGTGVTLTFGGGSLITEGVRAGMMAKFANLSVGGNNGIWFPILALSSNGRVATIPSGYLTDNASDNAFSLVIAKSLYTATPYEDGLWTVEEYWADLDRSKLGTDLRFNALNLSIAPDGYVRVGLGMGGRDLDLLATGDSPNFSSPTFIENGASLVLLDGGIYVNGVRRTDLTGLDFGLAAPISMVPLIGTQLAADVSLGQFALTGNFTGVVEDADDFESFTAEDRISVLLHCAEEDGNTDDFISFYLGNMSYAGYSTPAGGEGSLIQTIPLYGGEDERGGGYAASSIVVSTSAA